MPDDDATMPLPAEEGPADYFVEVEVIGQIDRYHLLRHLGAGAFGAVYLAWDEVAEIQVAIKSLPRAVSSHGEALERTRRNFSLVARLSHPNITTLRHLHEAVDVDEDAREFMDIRPGDYLIVMDYAPGKTLTKLRRSAPDGHLPVVRSLRICRQVAAALDYAHTQSIIHRDVKPGNIIVEDSGHVQVLDFGLAASIEESVARYSRELQKVCGTRQYMAPEQWQGTQQSPRTDQYQLAVVLHELLTGKVPFAEIFAETEDRQTILEHICVKDIPGLKCLSRRQNQALRRALSVDPENRFPSCAAFINDVAGINRKSPSAAMVMLLLVTVCLLAFVGYTLMAQAPWGNTAPPDREEARPTAPQPTPSQALIERRSEATLLRQQIEQLPGGQGFSEAIKDCLVRFNQANILFANDDFKAAEREYRRAMTAAQDLLNRHAARQQAWTVHKKLRQRRKEARVQDAENLASDTWAEARKREELGNQAIADGNFRDAEDLWDEAARTFQKAAAIADQHSQAKQKRRTWLNSLEAADTELLDEFGGSAWEELSFTIRVADRLLNDGQYREGRKLYQEAIEKLPEIQQQALLDKRRTARTRELREAFKNYEQLMVEAQAQSRNYAKRRERFRLYETIAAGIKGLLKTEGFPKDHWTRATDILDTIKTEQLRVFHGPEPLFDWTALDGDVSLQLAFVPSGDCLLGSNIEERAWVEDTTGKLPVNEGQTPQTAKVAQHLWMARTEVTVAQFRQFVLATGYTTEAEQLGNAWHWNLDEQAWERSRGITWQNPGYPYEVQPDFPVTVISWNDALAFCRWLTAREREQGRLASDLEYRLPTETEWEYACRAAQKGRPWFWWGNRWEDGEGRANILDASPLDGDLEPLWLDAADWEDDWPFAAPVDYYGKTGRNPFSLADMLGNAAEWALNSYDEERAAAEFKSSLSTIRVIRGGSYQSGPAKARCAARLGAEADTARQDIGFRVVCGRVIDVAEP